MKKAISILLLSAFLISTTELYQILKLPLLIEHFAEHKRLNEGTTLWTFLKIHYSNNNIRYGDYDKDMRLPFKSHDGCVNILSPTFAPTLYSYKVAKPFESEINTFKAQYKIFFKSAYLSNIWQPPRFC
ncbi:hypothetical protein [Daejeonella sp. H1SJ63]|uniref:hypothetical protein n=1 Tax=Daejeonella sp. H1SJ63 TaxID=3034145 RepID=UPI0023EE19EB|nr:hypothetical protein [Daejeonella sp. H1SJ63]